jgi:hypothetical protein
VGDLIGSGASQEEAIVGETPNLAALRKARAFGAPSAVLRPTLGGTIYGTIWHAQRGARGVSILAPLQG